MKAAMMLAALALAGCASVAHEEPMPVIVVAPGLAQRLAFMDRFRLNDQREVHVAVPDQADDEQPEAAEEALTADRLHAPPSSR